MITPLFTGLFDDAAMFPPASTPLPEAVRAHPEHLRAWYARLVGPFVCGAASIPQVDALAVSAIEVAVIAESVDAIGPTLDAMRRAERVTLAAVEVPLGDRSVADAARELRDVTVAAYVEVPRAKVDDAVVRELSAAGLRLKLRTGGTTAEAFPSESELAGAIARCVAAGLAAKCTAGLHHAVRHRDPRTGFEHHGFLNVLLAFHSGDPVATLAEQDATTVADAIRALTEADVREIRRLFASIGTCSIAEPLADLTSLGLA